MLLLCVNHKIEEVNFLQDKIDFNQTWELKMKAS